MWIQKEKKKAEEKRESRKREGKQLKKEKLLIEENEVLEDFSVFFFFFSLCERFAHWKRMDEEKNDDVLGGVGLMELDTPKSEDDSSNSSQESDDSLKSLLTALSSSSSSSAYSQMDDTFDDEVPKLAGATTQQLCEEYSSFLDYPNLLEQQVKETDAMAETILNRLDEVGALTDTVRSESTNIRRQILSLVSDCQNLPLLFDLIDKLLLLVNQMSLSLQEIEQRVEEAEDENSLSIGRFLSFVGATQSARDKFKRPYIPDTKEYFDKIRQERMEDLKGAY